MGYVRLVPGRYIVIVRKVSGNQMVEVQAENTKAAEQKVNSYMLSKGIIAPVIATCKIPEIINYIETYDDVDWKEIRYERD